MTYSRDNVSTQVWQLLFRCRWHLFTIKSVILVYFVEIVNNFNDWQIQKRRPIKHTFEQTDFSAKPNKGNRFSCLAKIPRRGVTYIRKIRYLRLYSYTKFPAVIKKKLQYQRSRTPMSRLKHNTIKVNLCNEYTNWDEFRELLNRVLNSNFPLKTEREVDIGV